jgi:hypothetical protein
MLLTFTMRDPAFFFSSGSSSDVNKKGAATFTCAITGRVHIEVTLHSPTLSSGNRHHM